MSSFPTIDLSHPEPAEVDRICRDTGFLSVVGHGFPDELRERTWRLATAFFDLPLASKMSVAMPLPGYPYGYAPFRDEALAQSLDETTPPDLKETFSIGPESSWSGGALRSSGAHGEADTQWPEEPPELAAALRDYFIEMGALAARLMSLFALALELPADYFVSHIDRHASALRLLNYPELDETPEPGQLRAGAHSDYGSLTILLAEPGATGLEIRKPGGCWRPVPIAPGAFVVNVGDLLARWSNDRWVSTVHRVRCDRERRQSIAFFHMPNWDAVIECVRGEAPKYGPVVAGEHLMKKFTKTVRPGPAG